jgi:hypothetical protein
MTPQEWSKKANELQKKAGRTMSRAELEQKLGKAKGKVTQKGKGAWGPRTGNRAGQGSRRSQNIKDATGEQSPEDRSKVKELQDEVKRRRTLGEDVELLHPGPGRPSLVGPQMRDLEQRGGNVEAARKRLRDAGYDLGDDPSGLEVGDGKRNRQEERDYQRMQRRLRQMEETQPSLPNHPDLITTSQQTMMGILTFAGGAAKLTWDVITDFGL